MVSLLSSYNRHSFINTFSSKCFQRARRALKNRGTCAHCAGYFLHGPPHPRPIIQPSLTLPGLQEADLHRLYHSGSFTLASRCIWLTEDTSRRLESRGERRVKVSIITPISLPAPVQAPAVSTLTAPWPAHSLGPRNTALRLCSF